MAFTRAFLKSVMKDSGVELPKEAEDAIIQAHLTARDAHATAESDKAVEAWKAENPQQEPQAVDVKKSEEYKALQKLFDDYKLDVESKAETATKTDLLRAALKAAGANEKFIDRMIKGADLSKVAVKDGALEKPDDVVAGFKGGEWGDVFGTTSATPTPLGTPPAGSTGNVDLGTLSMKDYIAARKKE